MGELLGTLMHGGGKELAVFDYEILQGVPAIRIVEVPVPISRSAESTRTHLESLDCVTIGFGVKAAHMVAIDDVDQPSLTRRNQQMGVRSGLIR